MPHLPYLDAERLQASALRPLVDRIVAERGSVLHLYQMLLHSPPLADGWLTFMTRVRQQLDLPGDLRELVIMRVALLNGAPYEAAQHHGIALQEGLTAAQLQALGDWQASSEFSAVQRQVLALCDAMTREIHVGAAQVEAVRTLLGDRQTVELVATIASYNMVSRFLEALQVRADDPR